MPNTLCNVTNPHGATLAVDQTTDISDATHSPMGYRWDVPILGEPRGVPRAPAVPRPAGQPAGAAPYATPVVARPAPDALAVPGATHQPCGGHQ